MRGRQLLRQQGPGCNRDSPAARDCRFHRLFPEAVPAAVELVAGAAPRQATSTDRRAGGTEPISNLAKESRVARAAASSLLTVEMRTSTASGMIPRKLSWATSSFCCFQVVGTRSPTRVQ